MHFGPLVAPVSFRDPVILARQAAAIDDLSGGRLILGLGAGWQDREHELFGYTLGDITTRFARLEEALEVVTRLFHDEAVTYNGQFYQLRGATVLPRPQRPGGPRILIGGNGMKRTLPLAARYAHVWNGTFLSPDGFKERSEALDALLQTVGRAASDVKRTMMTSLFFGRDDAELDRRFAWRRNDPRTQGMTLDQMIESVREHNAIVGRPNEVTAQINAYAAAGAQELMLQWFDLDDIDGLRGFAEIVVMKG
jgi:alkanesulfonate monooxygenase SsuD/methylene tetrahydromethanopterin reductase-like flavin-dependent oxidoreductase (luciferase family)